MKELKIAKSNELITACYNITLDEVRILNLVIEQINSRKKAVEQSNTFEFTVDDFINAYPTVDKKSAYKQVQKAIDSLGAKWCVTDRNEKFVEKVIFFTKQTYFFNEGRFIIKIHEDLMPYISNLVNKFTTYNLEHIAKLSTFYAVRIYELLIQFKKTGLRKITVEELKEILLVSDKYPRFNSFNQRILTPSIDDINEKTNLNVKVEQIKKGRKIVALEFKFKVKKESLALENKDQKRPKFPPITHYKYAKLDKQNPKMSSSDYATYSRDCLKILDDFYNDVESITIEDLRYYYIFLSVNASHRSKLFADKNAVYEEIQKRNYKLVNCELVEL